MPQDEVWLREAVFGFASAFHLTRPADLAPTAKQMPLGIAVLSPKCLAGISHVSEVLYQAAVYWSRGQYLARNKSLDLLMRLTCQSQIDSAIGMSGISNADVFAIVGLSGSETGFDNVLRIVRESHDGAKENDSLLELTAEKKRYLLELHSLPARSSRDRIVSYLIEKSAQLAFMK